MLQSFADDLVHRWTLLKVSIDEIGEQGRKVVRERDFFVAISVHPSHYGIDIVITDEI